MEENSNQLYDTAREFYLNYSREFHRLPNVRTAKKNLKIPINKKLSDYDIDLKKLKLEVIRQRLNEVFTENSDSSKEIICKELGVNIFAWVKPLGYENFSDLRIGYTGKAERRQKVFKTKKEASEAFENYFLDQLRQTKQLPPVEQMQKTFKTDRTTYVNPEEMKNIKMKVLRKRLDEIYEEKLNPKKDEIETCLGINLDNWKELLGNNYFKDYSKARKRFVNSMTGETFEEKNKKLISYVNLWRQNINGQKHKKTEEDMWKIIKQETGKIPNTFDIVAAKNYLLYVKEIEGNELKGGYWKAK